MIYFIWEYKNKKAKILIESLIFNNIQNYIIDTNMHGGQGGQGGQGGRGRKPCRFG